MIRIILIIGSLLSAFYLAGCGGASGSSSGSALESRLAVPPGFTPAYRRAELKDFSMGGATRKTLNIIVPAALTREALGQNMRHAARELYQQEQPDALIVFAYKEGDSTDGSYTAGMLTFAPYGEWGRAGEQVSPDKYQAVIEVDESYLQP